MYNQIDNTDPNRGDIGWLLRLEHAWRLAGEILAHMHGEPTYAMANYPYPIPFIETGELAVRLSECTNATGLSEHWYHKYYAVENPARSPI